MNIQAIFKFVSLLVVSLFFSNFSFAQSYPDKPIRLISPYGAGGNADLSARALSAALQGSPVIKEPIVVMNRVGAGGTIGSQFVKDSPNDGYTLLLGRVGSQVVAPALDPATPYKWDDFTIIGLLEIDPYVCVVRADSPFKTFQDLLDAVKKNPGKLSYASTGTLDASVVFPIKAFLNAGLNAKAALTVPYKGAGETVTAVLSGEVNFACNGLAPYIGNLSGGKMRALVVSTPERLASLPNTPTAQEVGMKNLELISGWNALYGPPNLSPNVVQQWSKVLNTLKENPKWVESSKTRGTIPSVMSPEESLKFISTQFKTYRDLLPYFQ
jgi:tripartite-type tricarboxylate transporter receptor subunit TctC